MIEDSKKKIIFIIGSMRRGGAERVISILANEYSDNGWEVQIITLLDNSNDYILRDSINVINITDAKKSRIQQLPIWLIELRKQFKKFNPDVIVSFIARINILTLIAALGLNKKIIISERSDPTADGRGVFVKLATYFLYPYANNIIFQTKWAKSCFPTKISRKGHIIQNPINITTKATDIRGKKIVAVGRLLPEKNHHLLIDAFSEIIASYPEYKLFIYGDGLLKDELNERITSLKLQDKVFLPGNVLDIHEKISDAEIFVLSSNYEGLSNALLEAMMMGIPCISTKCAGSTEVIDDKHNGLLVDIGNKYQLVQAVKYLLDDKNRAKEIGLRGMDSVTNFKSVNIIRAWKKCIENETQSMEENINELI